MTHRSLCLLLVAFGIIVAGAAVGHHFVQGLRWREQRDPETGVAIELRALSQVIKVGESPRLTVTLVNRGTVPVVLVEPGDGSPSGWRTPLVQWSTDGEPGLRCGNVNGLEPGEVFTLHPGESRQLCSWVGEPQLSGPGWYLVAVRYTNRPDLEWRGLPLKEHDAATMQRVRASTPMSAVSNKVQVIVER
jgi:hypothetical protein